jgi:Fe-S cluster biosynthesis and repair protein YggX
MDPDFGWHLKVGEQIVNERAVPDLETYNYTLEGRTWVDHEWLLNAAAFWIYDNWGYMALNIIFVLIIVATLVILNIIIYKYITPERDSFILIIIFEMLGLVASLPHLGVRMQEITILNLSLLLLIIYHYHKRKNIKTLFWLPLLFYFWASTHAGFLIGIFIMFFGAGIKFLENILFKFKFFNFLDYKNRLELKKIFLFLFFAALSVSATLLTPYGLKLYEFLKYYGNDLYLKVIQEWLPFYTLPIQYEQLFYSAFVVSAILFALIYPRTLNAMRFWLRRCSNLPQNTIFCDQQGAGYGLRKNKKISLWEIFISILFFAMALKSKRHFPLFFIVSFPLLIGFFSDFFSLPSDNFFNRKWKKGYFIVKPYLIIGLLAIIAFKIINLNFISDPFIYFQSKYPRDAITYLKNHPEYNNKKIFNEYRWGGYLLWAYPEKKIFIDGRLPMLPFKNRTFLEEYMDFFAENKTGEKLNEYGIGLVLLPRREDYTKLNWFEKNFLLLSEEKINDRKNYLKEYLEESAEWDLVYKDEVSDIYNKK